MIGGITLLVVEPLTRVFSHGLEYTLNLEPHSHVTLVD